MFPASSTNDKVIVHPVDRHLAGRRPAGRRHFVGLRVLVCHDHGHPVELENLSAEELKKVENEFQRLESTLRFFGDPEHKLSASVVRRSLSLCKDRFT